MFCFLLNWYKNSNFFKIAVWPSDSMKPNVRAFTFKIRVSKNSCAPGLDGQNREAHKLLNSIVESSSIPLVASEVEWVAELVTKCETGHCTKDKLCISVRLTQAKFRVSKNSCVPGLKSQNRDTASCWIIVESLGCPPAVSRVEWAAGLVT